MVHTTLQRDKPHAVHRTRQLLHLLALFACVFLVGAVDHDCQQDPSGTCAFDAATMSEERKTAATPGAVIDEALRAGQVVMFSKVRSRLRWVCKPHDWW